jgi:ATP-binding cassette subfamily F protein 3
MLAGFTNMTFEFGARTIVEDATWHIHPGERIGLIGYNGTGKSTMLKLLVGEYKPSSGTVERGRNTSIGYLHQDLLSFDTSESIKEVALGAFEKVRALEKEIEALGKQLESSSDEALLNLYTDKLHELELAGGWEVEHKTEEVLQGLGFANNDLQRPYQEFSGGWRMRVLLAKMILQQPDVLLLDEPTNHLDLPSIEWLEKYLIHYQGSVVIVSHDKYFLDRMVTKIVEVYQQQLHIYTGNYSYWEKEKALRIELAQRAYENQQEYIRQQERFIERFRAQATKAAQAQSAIKRLEKLDKLDSVELERPNMKINFTIARQPGKVLVTLKDATKRFGDLTIVDHAHAEVNRGDKIALIGANGKGKSTVLRMLAGAEPFEGQREWGHNVDMSFYAQHQLEALDLNSTILEELKNCGSGKNELELRSLLGCFLFTGDLVDKKIKILSGGEKARVALAKAIVSKANLLVLDEPTNHLDIVSVELLVDALNRYEGTVVLVSHDRYFISKAANTIWEIQDREIRDFKGTYTEYVEWKERMAKQAKASGKEDKPKTAAAEPEKPVAAPKPVENTATREQKKELQKLQRQLAKLEEDLARLKQEKTDAEARLASPDVYADQQKFSQAEATHRQLESRLKTLNAEYEQLFETVLLMEEEIG